MKEPLHSPTLYKPGYATITVDQGKTNKNVITLSTLHPASAFLIMPSRSQKRSKFTMTPNMVLILSIKWQGNTRLELTPVGRLCIRSMTHCGYKCMVHLQGGPKEDHTQKSLSSAVGLLAIWASQTKGTTLRKDGCKKKHPMKDTVKLQNTAKWRANLRRIAQWEPAIGAADHCIERALQKEDVCAWKTVLYTNEQACNQLGTPVGAKSFLREAQIF